MKYTSQTENKIYDKREWKILNNWKWKKNNRKISYFQQPILKVSALPWFTVYDIYELQSLKKSSMETEK